MLVEQVNVTKSTNYVVEGNTYLRIADGKAIPPVITMRLIIFRISYENGSEISKRFNTGHFFYFPASI